MIPLLDYLGLYYNTLWMESQVYIPFRFIHLYIPAVIKSIPNRNIDRPSVPLKKVVENTNIDPITIAPIDCFMFYLYDTSMLPADGVFSHVSPVTTTVLANVGYLNDGS